MCLACEQDAMWFAYLRRRGLITPDGQFVEEPPSLFVAEPAEAAPPQPENEEQGTVEAADAKKSSGDDPAAQ